jgi:hypothetical protein
MTTAYRIHNQTTTAALFLCAGIVLMSPPIAHAAVFNLGAFDQYGLLVNNGATGGDINTAPVNSNIGIGNVTGPVNLHNEVVNGKVDVSGNAASAVSGGAITGTQPVALGGALPSGSPASVNSNVASVQSAITAADNLSTTYGALALSGKSVTLTSSATINATSGTLTASGAYLFTAPVFSPGNGNTITINGTASQYVVIDITSGSGNSLNGALTLTGGILPDDVLINFIGSGSNLQGAANGATLMGTFLAPNLGVQLNSLTIDGHLFGGEAGDNFQFVSNAFIAQPALAAAVPEPSTWAMMLIGFAGVGFAAYRRTKKNTTALVAA